MPGRNDFLVWDISATNALSQSDYANLQARLMGFIQGVAPSNAFNKALLQSSIMSAALGELIKDNGDIASDTDIATLKQVLSQMILAFIGLSKKWQAGNVIIFKNATQVNSSATTFYTKTKYATVNQSGIVRVIYRASTNRAADTGYVRIYVNNVATGIENLITNSLSTFSEDINVNIGDEISIYAKSNTGGSDYYIRVYELSLGIMGSSDNIALYN